MDKIKELTDFYMWMQENGYDHNIRGRVERKAEMYLSGINVEKKLPIHNVSNPLSCIGCKYHDTLNDDLCGTCGDIYKNKAT